MANSNFVVHNGLTVGPLTIDAATGDLNTPGNINISGNVGVSSIQKNDSSISINDTGSGSSVVIAIDGTTEHTVDSDGVNLASGDRYAISGSLVLNATTLGNGVVNSSLTALGNLASLSVAGATTIFGATSTNGILFANSSAASTNTTSGALIVAGGIGIAGQLNVGGTTSKFTSNQDASSITTGAVVISGGLGVSGNAYIGSTLYIAGAQAATLADATALAIALGG